MNSYTSARIYVGVPNALSLNQAALDAAYLGIVNANVGWVRITLPWNAIQATSAPSYTWTAADLAINRALAAGLKIQVLLTGPLPSGVTAVTPAAFTPFVQAVAQRYKPFGAGITVPGGSVAEFQVWDEPNIVANWPSAVNAAAYVGVLKAAYGVIKASNSAAVVVAAGLQACTSAVTIVGRTQVSIRQDPVVYLNAMYTAGVRGYFDVAAYHPLTLPTSQFPDPPAPSGLTMVQADAFWAALKAKEPNKKVYWSRVGFVSGPVNGVGIISNEQQAAYLDTMRWFAEGTSANGDLRKNWVAGLALVSWRDA